MRCLLQSNSTTIIFPCVSVSMCFPLDSFLWAWGYAAIPICPRDGAVSVALLGWNPGQLVKLLPDTTPIKTSADFSFEGPSTAQEPRSHLKGTDGPTVPRGRFFPQPLREESAYYSGSPPASLIA